MSYQPPPNYPPPPSGDQWPAQGPGAPPPPAQGYPPPPGYPPQGYPQMPYGVPQGAPTYAVAQPQTSGLAITSLIFGILGLCTGLAGIVAVITGHMALSRIRSSNGSVTGRGLAIAGLVLGYISVAFVVLFIILIATSSLHGVTTTP